MLWNNTSNLAASTSELIHICVESMAYFLHWFLKYTGKFPFIVFSGFHLSKICLKLILMKESTKYKVTWLFVYFSFALLSYILLCFNCLDIYALYKMLGIWAKSICVTVLWDVSAVATDGGTTKPLKSYLSPKVLILFTYFMLITLEVLTSKSFINPDV